MTFDKKNKLWVGPSNSDQYLLSKSNVPQVSALMSQSVSRTRRDQLSEDVSNGLFRDGTAAQNQDASTPNSNVISSVGFNKSAQVVSGGGFRGGNGDSVKQTPEVYSPLWLNSNLNLPRDRATINAWCRSFYALNPFVHNAINLHSTYPISKLNIKCPNKEIERFFNDMIEEIDLMNICVQIAQEYWLLGESFVYAELDQSKGKWSRLLIQNPDYMIVKRTVVANEPIIMLKPDANLEKIIFSNKPSDIEQRKQLNQNIVDSVKRGQNIPLDNFNVHHLSRKISPYEIRGTGLPVCIFRQLMLFDKLRESKFAQADGMINPLSIIKIGSADFKPTFADLEAWRNVFECHDKDTEVLTDKGFKKFNEVIDYNETNNKIISVKPKENIKIACFNSDTEQLEYHHPKNASLYNYNGDMYHFHNKKIDIKVTPNHKMWVSKRGTNSKYGNWHKINADQINVNNYFKLRSNIKWEGINLDSVKICDKDVGIENYLEFLGYLLSEGSVYYSNNRNYYTAICQSTITDKKYQPLFQKSIENFAGAIGLKCKNVIKNNGMWEGLISSKELFNYFKTEIGEYNDTKSKYKHIPKWVLELSPNLLNILLKALVAGDGSVHYSLNNLKYCRYTTISKQLADDIYEIIYKCGYVPLLSKSIKNKSIVYNIGWSEDINGKGDSPVIHDGKRSRDISPLTIEKYNDKVWCFEVPTGLFITRRNGKITIQGNSAQYDKDFKIFTHEGVSVERVGFGQGIYDISGDITQLIKEIYVGLQVPSVLMDGGADTTYANGGVALDVLRQRYMQFRNMMSNWLKRKIFAPISKIQGFYDYSGGQKQLIVPEIDWNHMSLFDAGDYIQTLVGLTQGGDASQKRASLHTLYRSMGLEFEDEVRKLRKESIQTAIFMREKSALEKMDLNALRALDEEDEIPEPINEAEEALPGEKAPAGDTGLPGLDMGAPPGGAPPSTPPL